MMRFYKQKKVIDKISILPNFMPKTAQPDI